MNKPGTSAKRNRNRERLREQCLLGGGILAERGPQGSVLIKDWTSEDEKRYFHSRQLCRWCDERREITSND